MPFAEHAGFDRITDDVKIWRYVDLAKLVDMILTRRIAFVRADKMADRFEGTLPSGALTALKDVLDPLMSREQFGRLAHDTFSRDFASEYALRTKGGAYYSCWHMSEFESGAMWPIYADRGFAIESTVGGLKDAIAQHSDHLVHIGSVQYVDIDDSELFRGPYRFHGLYKRRLYDFERELRAVIFGDVRQVPDKPPPTISVNVDLPDLLLRLWVGPGQSGWVTQMIEDLLNAFDLPNIDVVRSTMDDDPLATAR